MKSPIIVILCCFILVFSTNALSETSDNSNWNLIDYTISGKWVNTSNMDYREPKKVIPKPDILPILMLLISSWALFKLIYSEILNRKKDDKRLQL